MTDDDFGSWYSTMEHKPFNPGVIVESINSDLAASAPEGEDDGVLEIKVFHMDVEIRHPNWKVPDIYFRVLTQYTYQDGTMEWSASDALTEYHANRFRGACGDGKIVNRPMKSLEAGLHWLREPPRTKKDSSGKKAYILELEAKIEKLEADLDDRPPLTPGK